MRRTDEQLAEKRREKFESVVLRIANQLQMSSATKYEDLPETVKIHFEKKDYKEIALDLARFDYRSGLNLGQISLKYGLSKTTVWRHLSSKAK